MKHLGVWTGLMIVTALFSLGDATRVLAGETVPIKGRFRGRVISTPLSQTELIWQLDSIATGPVSHLGHIVATFSFPAVKFDLANMLAIVASPEWFDTFTAANGDQIVGMYALTTDTLPVNLDGDIDFEADLFVISGTGRFAKARGEAFAVGTANVFTRTFTVEFKGRLTTVGSSKK
jgi:hypothetical protein